jgi:two-component system sensor histidine kinase BaeS
VTPRFQTLRSRLFLGIAATVAVSVTVTVVAGALLTRRSLETSARHALTRQIDLIAAQRQSSEDRLQTPDIGVFLATEQQRLTILTPEQAELLLPAEGATSLRAGHAANGTVEIQGRRFLYAARLSGDEALVLLRSADSAAADWTPFLLGLAAAGLVGGALAGIVALLLARAVARPVREVADASRRLAAGEEPTPLAPAGSEEVRALAESFNHLARELARAQDAERAFLLSVSHELKTPLTAIRGHAEALADGVMDADRASEVIEREARRLERLIQDVLELARLRRRSFSIRQATVDLNAVAADAAERHEAQARSYGVSLDVVLADEARAEADPDRVLQAVSNLVENALRSTPRGGSVRVVAGPGRLDVVDDGPGIASDDLEHAFERFYLYERYGSERPVGTGLGLAIVHELASAMGGTVEARSTLGVGSTFSIVLPTPRSLGGRLRLAPPPGAQTPTGGQG